MSELRLAIDTATGVCAAIARDGEVLASGRVDDTRAHTEALTPLIQRLCSQAGVSLHQLDAVMVGVGPGPFTGLRVGVVTALTLAELISRPATGVCTLDVVARHYLHQGGDQPTEFVAAVDARRRELYWARYGADGRRLDGPYVSAPASLPDLPVVGPLAEVAVIADDPRLRFCAPLEVGVMAANPDEFADAGLEPMYLRKPDAEVARTRKSALQPGLRLRLPSQAPDSPQERDSTQEPDSPQEQR